MAINRFIQRSCIKVVKWPLCLLVAYALAGTAQAGNNTLSISTPAPGSANAGSSFNVAATLPYVFGNDCGNQVRIVVTAGSCTGGNASWTGNGATCTSSGLLTRNITMPSGAQTACVISVDGHDSNSANGYPPSVVYTVKVNQSINVTQPAPASAVNGETFSVAATATSGLPVAITATGGCTVNNGVVTMTSGSVACTVNYNQAGDANFTAAQQVSSQTSAVPHFPLDSQFKGSAVNDSTNVQ